MVIKNKKASFNYEFIQQFTAGIILLGTEIKPLRHGNASIKEAYCFFKKNELFIKGMYIGEHNIGEKHDTIRDRKLLLNKKELVSLQKELTIKGLTIVPITVFFNENGYAKLTIALSKGKGEWDKRQSVKRKDIERENQIKIK